MIKIARQSCNALVRFECENELCILSCTFQNGIEVRGNNLEIYITNCHIIGDIRFYGSLQHVVFSGCLIEGCIYLNDEQVSLKTLHESCR